ncbi:MAG: plastocyanin/azurin family copper-binding protein [Opitutae bacterium]
MQPIHLSLLAFFSFFICIHAKEKITREIVISGNDAMQFDIKKFEAVPGESIRLTLKNIGTMPKIAMGHNLVVLKKDIDAIAFGQKVLASGGSSTNPLPKSLLGDVIAYTKLLGPGESETITIEAPTVKGDYQYVCTFPGHFAMMRGTMEVK